MKFNRRHCLATQHALTHSFTFSSILRESESSISDSSLFFVITLLLKFHSFEEKKKIESGCDAECFEACAANGIACLLACLLSESHDYLSSIFFGCF